MRSGLARDLVSAGEQPGTTEKTARVRILHAVLFEIGLLTVLVPFIAW